MDASTPPPMATTAAGTSPEQQQSSPPPSLEELTRRSTRTMIIPHILAFIASAGPSTYTREVYVFVNPLNWSITLFETRRANLEAILREKLGQLPASKESIDAMPVMKVTESELECAICLAEFEIGEESKEMPCKHRFHAACIEKWLGIRGSCPMCRYTMPLESKLPENTEIGNDVVDGDDVMEAEEEDGDTVFFFHVYYVGRRFRRRVRYSETVVAGPNLSSTAVENDEAEYMDIDIPPTAEEIETHEIENRTYPD